MFKRIEKRLKRKEREDELGLDDDMKEILGLNDTDSDESDSDSEEDSTQGDFLAQNQDIDLDEEEEQADVGSDDDEEEDDAEGNAERALVTISEALTNPIFIVSLDPDIQECIVCPGRLLKGSAMAAKHKSSNAHQRRFKQFQKLAASTKPRASAQELVEKAMSKKSPQNDESLETSKRAEKKRIAREKRKIKREKFRVRQKAKKDALPSNESVKSEKDLSPSSRRARSGDEKRDQMGIQEPKDLSRQKVRISASNKTHVEPVEAKKSRKYDPHDASERPKKRQKSSTILPDNPPPSEFTTIISPPTESKKRPKLLLPTIKKPKPKPIPEQEESKEVIQELQSQVEEIIKSASSLAKAARARALGGDGDSLNKSSKSKSSISKTKTRKS